MSINQTSALESLKPPSSPSIETLRPKYSKTTESSAQSLADRVAAGAGLG